MCPSDPTNPAHSIDIDRFGTREAAVRLPMDMEMTAYLLRQHRVPRLNMSQGLAYHYTNADGLFGILRSSRFWATDSAFLNDPTEGSYAIDIAKRVLGGRAVASATESKLISESLKTRPSGARDLFTVSFCRDGDLLSQWRGYGSFGAGYALGFDLAELTPHPQVGWLIEINYNDEHLSDVITDVFDIYMEYLTGIDKGDLDLHLRDVAGWGASILRFIAQGYKHPKYEEEDEIRLVFKRYSSIEDRGRFGADFLAPISYRPRGSDLVPFISTEIGLGNLAGTPNLLPLKRIVLGPGVAFERNMKALEGFMHACGYADVDVVQSEIPFRV